MALFQDVPITQEEYDKQRGVQQDSFSKFGYDEILQQRQLKRNQIAEQENNWVKNIVSPEKVQQWKNQGNMTAIEVWHKKDKNELMPYMGTWKEGSKSFKIKNISDKLQTGQNITPEERKMFENFVLDLAEVQTRGYSLGGLATNIGLETIPFMAEFALGLLTTGGTSSFGATTSKLGTETLKKSLLKQITEGIAKTALNTVHPRTIAFTATRLPQQVRARMGDIMLSDSLAISPEGQAILKESETSPAIAFMKALALTNIETASEMSGQMLVRPTLQAGGKLGKVIASPIMKRLPKGFADNFVKLAENLTKLPFVKAVDDLGFNGILEEMGEERVGDLLKFAFNLDDKQGYSFEQFLDALFPNVSEGVGESAKQLGAEALSFAITGAGMNAIHHGLKALPVIGDKYTKDGFLLDAGIFRVNGYDSYLDKKVKETLTKQGKSEDEIDNAIHFSTREDKVQYLKNTKTEFDSKKEYDAKEFEKDLKKQEIEDTTFNKFLNVGVNEQEALGLSKLMGKFFNNNVRSSEEKRNVFQNLLNNLEVRFNVPVNKNTIDDIEEIPFQSAKNPNTYFQAILSDIDKNKKVDVVDLSEQFSDAENLSKKELSQHIKSLVGTQGISSSDKKAIFNFLKSSKRIGKKNVYVPDHIAGSSKVENKLKSERNTTIKNIVNLLENAVLIEKTKNNNKQTKPNVDNYLRFYVPVKINNNIFTVRIVAENNDKKNLFNILNADVYDVIIDKKIPTSSPSPKGNLLKSVSDNSITDNAEKFNTDNLTIEEMLKDVKDAEGKVYFQSDDVMDYDPKIRKVRITDKTNAEVQLNNSLWIPTEVMAMEGLSYDRQKIGAETWLDFNRRNLKHYNIDELERLPKEEKREEKSTKEFNPEIEEIAEKHFGTTTNLKEAGYILNNGKLLDLSGKKFGGVAGRRSIDHREIVDAFIESENPNYEDIGFEEFIDNGAIRYMPESATFLIAKMPSEKQFNELKKIIDSFNGEVSIEMVHNMDSWGKDGNFQKDYEQWSDSRKILEDVKTFFNGGKISPMKTYYQESDNENVDDIKAIAGFTYPEVMDKLTAIYEELGNKIEAKAPQKEIDNLNAKVHILEDAFSIAEGSDKFNNEDKNAEIMLNAYYIMNNQEIPQTYIDEDSTSLRTLKDIKKIREEKKSDAVASYYGYFSDEGEKSIITIMANSNASTALHELGHFFLKCLNELAKVDDESKKKLDAVNKQLGFSGEYTIEQQEKFARSFEAYLYKGKAPNNYLRQVFEDFKEWLKSVYNHIVELENKGADISPEVQKLFDNIFSGDEYYEERKQSNKLLKKVRNITRKEKIYNVAVRNDETLDEVEKRHKDVAYSILSVATGKDKKYLMRIFETNSTKNGYGRRREVVEQLLEKAEDRITTSGGMRDEWKEFYSDTGVSYDNDEVHGDYELAEQALDTIINKSYRNPDKMVDEAMEMEAEYYEKAIDEADKQYKMLFREFKKGNRNVALSAMYEWLENLDKNIKQDYEDRFVYDARMIERNEHADKFEKAKRQILAKALELENQHSINTNEGYKEVVKEVMKNLNFLQPSDKAKLTVNILDVQSTSFLMSSIDNILDIAKTMEDSNYRRKLEADIHKELQKTKNVKKNGRSVGKYDYKTNKLFEELRELDKLHPEQANELRLEASKFVNAEDNGLSYKDKLINKFLSYKAGGRTFADTELMKELYDEITKIKLIGKSAKSELDLQDKISEEKDIEELIKIVQNKKEANPIFKIYVNGVANLESALNAIFNNDIKERYGAEILYAETQSQAWQHQQKQNFERGVAKIYNLPEWNWDKVILDYLGQKKKYNEIRRKYDTDGKIVKTRNIERELTKMDLIQAYIWSKNEVLEKRLINQFGEDTLIEMLDELSLQDVKLAELMMQTAQSFYPLVNKTFIRKYGLDLPKVSCYFPSTPERGSEVDLYNDYSSKSLGNSFTKARAQSETQAMDFHNPVATLYSHIDGVAKFVFMSESLDKANLRFKDLDLKRVIINKYGKDVYKTLEQSLINITYKKEAPVFNGMNKLLDNLIGNWIQANVAVKPIVGLKQLLSANNYAVDMPYMKWQMGFLKALSNPKETIDYMMNIPYIKARFEGSYSNEFLKQTVENSAFAKSKKLKDCCNLFIRLGDIGAIIFGGKPYVDYLINEKGMPEEQAIKQFILSTNRSQQSSAVSSLSNFQVAMTRSPIGKLFIAFKNSPQQYARMCGDAIVSACNGDISKGKMVQLLFQYGYLQPLLYTLATSGSILRWMFAGDDDDLLNDLKMTIFNFNANALPLIGDIYQFVLNKINSGKGGMTQTTPLLGDIEKEINKFGKKDSTLADYLESIGYLGLHVGLGYNSKAITNMASGVGDLFTGEPVQGSMKVLGYTEKRAKHIAGNKNKE